MSHSIYPSLCARRFEWIPLSNDAHSRLTRLGRKRSSNQLIRKCYVEAAIAIEALDRFVARLSATCTEGNVYLLLGFAAWTLHGHHHVARVYHLEASVHNSTLLALKFRTINESHPAKCRASRFQLLGVNSSTFSSDAMSTPGSQRGSRCQLSQIQLPTDLPTHAIVRAFQPARYRPRFRSH